MSRTRAEIRAAANIASKAYRKTRKGWMNAVYQTMKSNSRLRGHAPPNFTRKEFDAFIDAQPHFHMLFEEWEKSGFDKWKRPSIDRIDNNKSYKFDNMRLVTWRENYNLVNTKEYRMQVMRWCRSKFKKEDILFIRDACARGMKHKYLAELFGVSVSTIHMMNRGVHWEDV